MKTLPNRVCDYVILVDYSITDQNAKVVSRFPFKDHIDAIFPIQIAHFCFPYKSQYLPSDDKNNEHTFVLTESDGVQIFGVCLQFKQNSVYRAICITSHWNFSSNFQKFINKLYHRTMEDKEKMSDVVLFEEYEIPIERVVSNLIFEVPVPPFGKTIVKTNHLNGLVQIYKRSAPNQLNCLFFDFMAVFRLLTVSNILNIISAILNEKKILFLSENVSLLTPVAESFCSLIFPFFWPHVFVPMLPVSYKDLLLAPMPFICGLLKSQFDFNIEISDILIVDLDTNILRSVMEKPIIAIPSKYSKKLSKNIKKIIDNKNIMNLPKTHSSSKTQKMRKIRNKFIKLFSSIIGNYKNFIYDDFKEAKRNFNTDRYLLYRTEGTGEFYKILVSTQLFQYFIQTVLMDAQEPVIDTRLLYFDEVSREKSEKSDFLLDISMKHQMIYKCLTPDIIGLNMISILINHKNFPLFNEKLAKPPREIQSLTTEFERQGNSFDLENRSVKDYFRKKYSFMKHVVKFGNLTDSQNAFFDKMIVLNSKNNKIDICKQNHEKSVNTAFNEIRENSESTLLKEIFDDMDILMEQKFNNSQERKVVTVQARNNFIFSSVDIKNKINGLIKNFYKHKYFVEAKKIELDRVGIKRRNSILSYNAKLTHLKRNSVESSSKQIDTEFSNSTIISENNLVVHESKKILFDLMCDNFDLIMKKMSRNLKYFSNKRLKSFFYLLEEETEANIEYHSKMLSAWEKMKHKTKEKKPNVCLNDFYENESNLIKNLFSKQNILKIHKKELEERKKEERKSIFSPLKNYENTKHDLNNLFSFNLWGKNGTNEAINCIESGKTDTNELIRLIENMLILTNFTVSNLNGFYSDKNQPRKKAVKHCRLKMNNFTHLLWDLVEFKLRFSKKMQDFYRRKLEDLKIVITNLNSSVKAVKDSLKSKEKTILQKKKDIVNLNLAKKKNEENVSKLRKDLHEAEKGLGSASMEKLGDFSKEFDLSFRSYCKSVEKKLKTESDYTNEKTLLGIFEVSQTLFKAFCMDFLQERDKERYLTIKSTIITMLNIVKDYVSELKRRIIKLEESFKEISEKNVEECFFSYFGLMSSIGSNDKQKILNKKNISQTDLKKTIDTIDSRNNIITDEFKFALKYLSQIANYKIECINLISKMELESITFTSSSSQILNASLHNIILSINEYFNSDKRIAERTLRHQKELLSSINTYSMAMQQEIEKSKTFLSEVRSAGINMEKMKKKDSFVNFEEIFTHVVKQFPQKRKNFIEQSCLFEKKAILEFKAIFAQNLLILKEEMSSEEKLLEQNKKFEEISRLVDTKIFFEKNRRETPPKSVLAYLEANHTKEETFKKISVILDDDLVYKKTQLLEAENSNGNEMISFFDTLSLDLS